MRVAIDCSAIPPAMAGAGVYTYQLVRAMAGMAGGPRLTVFARDGLFDDISACAGLRLIRVKQMTPALRLVWEQLTLPLLLRQIRPDVLHSPHHHAPLLTSSRSGARIKRVVTVHDVTFFLLPGRYSAVRRLYMQAVTRAAARVADAIIVPSEAVRADLQKTLGRSHQVVVVPEAAAEHFRPVEDITALGAVRTRYGLPERYVLSVGSLEPGKNRGRIFLAYRSLINHGPVNEPLVIIGQPAWGYRAEFDLVSALGLHDRVRYLGYVPDEDMPAIYSCATALVFPSLYEGFGLPVLEAMASGTPVITSNTGATAEVAGDAAALVDPRSVESIASAILRVVTDAPLREQLRASGIARSANFSWERAAHETLAVYETAAATR